MKVTFGRQFKIAFSTRIEPDAELVDLFREKLSLFMENPQNPVLRTHKLHGNLKDHHAFSIHTDCRVVFKYVDADSVILIDIGNHDEVY